jgi:hypothetical protein
MIHALTKKSLIVALTLGLSLSSVACGPGQPAKDVKTVVAGSMPAGGSWEGVYYNQLYGELHVTVSGNSAQGVWRTTAGDRWGELFGELEGDVMRFQWTEYKIGVVGPNAKSEGKGFFKYSIPVEGDGHVLTGEWGLGESNSGQTWRCVKMMNKEADPKSQRPNELENSIDGGGFDEDSKKAKKKDDAESEKKDEGNPDSQGL